MKRERLQKAKQEAQRFLAAIDVLERMTGTTDEDMSGRRSGTIFEWYSGPCQYCAAVKRSSMDLTRALADVRI